MIKLDCVNAHVKHGVKHPIWFQALIIIRYEDWRLTKEQTEAQVNKQVMEQAWSQVENQIMTKAENMNIKEWEFLPLRNRLKYDF